MRNLTQRILALVGIEPSAMQNSPALSSRHASNDFTIAPF
jgi:hypothetical protein